MPRGSITGIRRRRIIGSITERVIDGAAGSPLTLEEGYIVVPDGPGIGLDLLEDEVERFAFQDRTTTGNFARDGSVAH